MKKINNKIQKMYAIFIYKNLYLLEYDNCSSCFFL